MSFGSSSSRAKRESLGLAGTIAVCSKGFSKSAQIKAQRRGITLKTYRQVADPGFLVDFQDGVQVRHLVQRGTIQELSYETDDDEPALSEEAQARLISAIGIAGESAALLRNATTGEVTTVGQVIKACLSRMANAPIGVTSKNCRLEFPPKTIILEPVGMVAYVRRITLTLKVEVTVQAMENPNLMAAAFEIACRTGRTAYDSVYLALAIRHDCLLVTADRRFLNALGKTPMETSLLWVGDLLPKG